MVGSASGTTVKSCHETRSGQSQTPGDSDSIRNRRTNVGRRNTIPMELEDPEDCTVGESEADYFASPRHDNDVLHTNLSSASVVGSRVALSPSILIPDSVLELPKEVRNIFAGGIAGMVAKSVVAPLDRIKILYQVSNARFRLTDVPIVARTIVRDEGLGALWKGNMATMIRVFPYSGIQFMVFDWCKQYFLQHHDSAQHTDSSSTTTATDRHDRKWGLTPLESLISGMIAGTVSVACTYPLDLVRAQLAVLKHKASHNQGFVGILKENYSRGGVVGLFRGIAPTLIGILPYSGIAFALNEQGKREIEHLTGREVTTMERIQCGAFSGLVAQTVTYPIEVTRRRMQTIGLVGVHNDSALSSLNCATQRQLVTSPPTLMSTITQLYADQGMRGFLKGVSMNWMKGPVAFSISFTTFDYVKKLLESPTERSRRLPN